MTLKAGVGFPENGIPGKLPGYLLKPGEVTEIPTLRALGNALFRVRCEQLTLLPATDRAFSNTIWFSDGVAKRLLCDYTRDLLFLGSAGNPDIIRSQNLGIGKIGRDLDILETALVLGHGAKNQKILTIEQLLQSFQVRFKTDRV